MLRNSSTSCHVTDVDVWLKRLISKLLGIRLVDLLFADVDLHRLQVHFTNSR
jgi:hypothetical protein